MVVLADAKLIGVVDIKIVTAVCDILFQCADKLFFKDLVASSGLYFHVLIFLRGYIAGCMICCFTTHSRQNRLYRTLDTIILMASL